MQAQVKEWGNSQGVRLSKEIYNVKSLHYWIWSIGVTRR